LPGYHAIAAGATVNITALRLPKRLSS
jgi:hypothetical protein